ncbi:O-antigen polymerase [Campylobacter sp. CCUG 57310]|uniref:O-antigen polymerase n=1 Tax=Campylobacter sp. CCUG 57310 TaxID=2517362 RepID=UPI0015666CA2|nr:O-antigen polymerase [Campylobacter sp. CCUG 57310]QKF91992.1 putative membrane protein [Campylobacter sp. CCUG 57310]
MKISKKLFYPLYFFIFVWLFYIFIRGLLINWESLNEITVLTVFLFICFVILCYVLSVCICANLKHKIQDIGIKKINKTYYFLQYLSMLYISLAIIRFLIEINDLNIELNSLSVSVEARERTMEGSIVSGTFLGISTTLLSGFHILFLMFTIWMRNKLTSMQLNMSILIFVIGDVCFLFGGGRNAVFISILMVSMCVYFIKFANIRKITINKTGLFVCIFLTMIIFLYIFIARDEYNGISMIDRLNLNEYNYNIKFNSILIDLLHSEYKIIQLIAYFTMSIVFYLTHSLSILDSGLTSSLPENAYYFGAMQFYPLVFLINKLGFNIITIKDILNEWELAGNYSTLLLPLYYDFGLLWSLILIMILVFLFVYNAFLLLNSGRFISCVLMSIVGCVFVLSPIYSFFSLGIFLPIFFSFIVLYTLLKVKL